jgi:hypothetical protein
MAQACRVGYRVERLTDTAYGERVAWGHWVRLASNPVAGNRPASRTAAEVTYSGMASPEPPNSFGKSFNFGRPSFMGSTVSA